MQLTHECAQQLSKHTKQYTPNNRHLVYFCAPPHRRARCSSKHAAHNTPSPTRIYNIVFEWAYIRGGAIAPHWKHNVNINVVICVSIQLNWKQQHCARVIPIPFRVMHSHMIYMRMNFTCAALLICSICICHIIYDTFMYKFKTHIRHGVFLRDNFLSTNMTMLPPVLTSWAYVYIDGCDA